MWLRGRSSQSRRNICFVLLCNTLHLYCVIHVQPRKRHDWNMVHCNVEQWRRALKHLVMFQAFVVQTSISRVTTSVKVGISEPFEQPTLYFDKGEWTSKIEYFDPWILNVCVCWYQWLFTIWRLVVVVYILHYFSKHFTRAIFIEETNSLAQIFCTCKHGRITLIMNKMLVAFAFRALAVFIHAFLHKQQWIEKNKTKSKNYIGLFATISAPPIYIIYVHEKLRT